MPTPLPVLPGVYYGHLKAIADGLPTGNIFSWKVTPAPGTPVLDEQYALLIANLMASNWVSTMLTVLPDTITGVNALVYPLGAPTMPAQSFAAPGGGVVSGPRAPLTAAAVIHTPVLRRGKGSQSPMRISPIAAASVTADGKSLTAGNVAAFTNEIQNFQAAVINGFLASYPATVITRVQLSKKGVGATYTMNAPVAQTLLGTARARGPRG